MVKVLMWLISNDDSFFKSALNILQRQHNELEFVGVIAAQEISMHINGKIVPFISPAGVTGEEAYDVLLAVGAKQIGMSKITQVALQLNLPEEKLLGDWIVCIPGFTLEKYRRLQRSRLSIFSLNCFGGIISHTLGLSFNSPFINMFFEAQSYLRFLREPRNYLSEKLILKEMKWQPALKFNYPVVKMLDAEIHLNHYPDFNEAIKIWERRKARINWYNLFVTAYTEREDFLKEFDALPYGKKVCFTSFKSDLDSAWYINREKVKRDFFWQNINDFARGNPFFYDPFDMLLYGKKTPLIEM